MRFGPFPFPIAPLLDLIEPEKVEGPWGGYSYRRGVSQLARRTGLPRSRLQKRLDRGLGLDVFEADQAAVALNMFPSEIWGAQWWADQ